MSGVKGRSGGRNRKPASLHLIQGTYRPDRHGVHPAIALGQPPVEPAPAELLDGLGRRGAALVLGLWQEYSGWNSGELALLRQAGEVADRLDAYRARIADAVLVTTARGTSKPHALLRLEAQARGTLIALLGALRLQDR
jgi:hypothetical protein